MRPRRPRPDDKVPPRSVSAADVVLLLLCALCVTAAVVGMFVDRPLLTTWAGLAAVAFSVAFHLRGGA